MSDLFFEELPIYCSLCGGVLGNNPDDQPDWLTGPLCGDCYQARQQEGEVVADQQNDPA